MQLLIPYIKTHRIYWWVHQIRIAWLNHLSAHFDFMSLDSALANYICWQLWLSGVENKCQVIGQSLWCIYWTLVCLLHIPNRCVACVQANGVCYTAHVQCKIEVQSSYIMIKLLLLLTELFSPDWDYTKCNTI